MIRLMPRWFYQGPWPPGPGHMAPAFVTDNYKSGSPRMVIELNNGKNLVGYPATSGLNGTDMAWAVGNSGTYTSYATAYAATNANTTTIREAFIVEDADQPASATDTLTGIQFGGATVHPVYSNIVQIKNRETGKCLNEEPDQRAFSSPTPASQALMSACAGRSPRSRTAPSTFSPSRPAGSSGTTGRTTSSA